MKTKQVKIVKADEGVWCELKNKINEQHEEIKNLKAEIEELQTYPADEPYIHYEDARYPTLVIPYDNRTEGYSINLSDLTLRRVCICAARSGFECVCGAWEK